MTRFQQAQKFYDALYRIAQYDSPERLKKRAERDYGLDGGEAIEMAYDNVISEAKSAIKGLRRPTEAKP